MAKISFLIQMLISKSIGYVIAFIILVKLFFNFVFSPKKFVRTFFKTRDVMPACLNDPLLGKHGFIYLENVKLHYVISGDENKPLMLCLHGFPEFWYSWRYQIREFNKDYRVVAIDQRGYGDSDKPSGYKNYTIEKLTSDIAQLIPALGYKKCVLLSHDWGGAVAWHFTAKYPDMVEKLIVFNCPHPITFKTYLQTHFSQLKKSWYMMFFQAPYIPEMFFFANDMEALDKIFGGIRNNKPDQETVEAYKYVFSKGGVSGPINYYRAAVSTPVEKSSRSMINVPVMVVWGEPDFALETELAELAGEYASNLTVKIIKNSNHFVIVDKPNECNAVVREFLERR